MPGMGLVNELAKHYREQEHKAQIIEIILLTIIALLLISLGYALALVQW